MTNLTRRRLMGLTGGALLGTLGYLGGKTLTEKLMSPPGEFLRDGVVSFTYDRANRESLEEVLPYLSSNVRNMYETNRRDQPGLDKGWLDYIETGIRASQRIPTDKLPGAKEVIGLKERILRATKGWISGDKDKKEVVEPQANPDHAKNYHDLSRYRMSLMARVSEIEESMNELAQKTLINRKRNSLEWERGLAFEEVLIREHDRYIGLMRDFKSLTPLQIQAGTNDEAYVRIMETVKDYNIKPYEPHKSSIIETLSEIAGGVAGTSGFLLGSKILGRRWFAGISGLGEVSRLVGKALAKIYFPTKKEDGKA